MLIQNTAIKSHVWDFHGSPVVQTPLFNAGGMGSIPDQRARVTCFRAKKKQNMKQKQHCNKFNKDFFFFSFLFLFVVNFVIDWNETAMGLHVFPMEAT